MYLLSKFSASNLIDFSKIKWTDFVPAMKETVQEAKEKISLIKLLPPSFTNTIKGIEQSTNKVNQVEHIFACLLDVNKDPKQVELIDKINEELSSLSSNLGNDIVFDQELFALVKQVRDSFISEQAEENKLLDQVYKSFIDNGVNLPPDKQERLRVLDEEIDNLGIKINSNLLEEPLTWEVVINDESELEGIPDQFVKEAGDRAKAQGISGWSFKVNAVTVLAILEFAQSEKIRFKFAQRYRSRGRNQDKYDNSLLIESMLKLKQERAKILGHQNASEMILKDLMLKTPKAALDFLNKLEQAIRVPAQKEFTVVSDQAKAENISLTKADELFIERKIKESMANVDFEKLREFFPVPKVWSGLSQVCSTLFDVQFIKLPSAPVWNETVEAFKVVSGDRNCGVLYLDLYSRDEKQAGAWMNTFVDGALNQEAIVIVACNFAPPTKTHPSLLNLEEVKTLFHEIGHALHGLLGKSSFSSLNGVNVAWDFVELPSQLMENFVTEKEVLKLISSHYQTNEPLPEDVTKKIKKISQAFKATNLLAYVGSAKIDLELHLNENFPINFEEWEAKYNNYTFTPELPGGGRIRHFSHIWGGGYSSTYYSYFWSELLDANCFTLFKERGVLSQEIGKKFKEEILEVGSSRDELISFVKFKGAEPEIKPYLEKLGVE